MSQPPKISIIMPVYNTQQYLPQAIDSIISQTFTDWELLLLDDGSTDRSGKICDDYAVKDSRIRVIHKSNTGLADTCNLGIANARAELLGFVDADDWIEPKMFQTLYEDITRENAQVAICGYIYEWRHLSKLRNKDVEPVSVYNRQQILQLTYDDKKIQSIRCDKLWHKSVATVPFPKGYFYEDFATTIKWMANVKKVVHRTTPFYHYRMRKGSIVNDSLPSHRYHYLLAELGRIDFLRSIGFVPESESFSSRVLHTAVTAAKLIARTSSDRATALEYISKIVKAIRPYLPGDKKELGRKTYSRLEKLLTHPSWFITSVRFSRLFMFGSRRKEKQLFD